MFEKAIFAFFSLAFFFGSFWLGAIALLHLHHNEVFLALLMAVGSFTSFAGACMWGYTVFRKNGLSD